MQTNFLVCALGTLNPGSLQILFNIPNNPLPSVILQFRNWRRLKIFLKVQALSSTESRAWECCPLIPFSSHSSLLGFSISVFPLDYSLACSLQHLHSVVSKFNDIKTTWLDISRGLQESTGCSRKSNTARKMMNAVGTAQDSTTSLLTAQ